MGNFFTAVKRGVQAMGETPTGERYSVGGQSVLCGHCRCDHFVEGHAQLNTAGMTFLNLDWANRSAAILSCTACGHIEWFYSASAHSDLPAFRGASDSYTSPIARLAQAAGD